MIKIFYIFVLFINSIYVYSIKLNSPQDSCNSILRNAIDEPSVLGSFNIMKPFENLSLENMPGEIWKDIPGYEGSYMVSNLGRVKSLVKKGEINEKILRQPSDTIGYKLSFLYKDANRRTFKTHRLVMLAFVGDSNLSVDHLNEVKWDNRLENLEYVTQRENTRRYYSKSSEYPVGVSRARSGRYKAVIVYKKKSIHLGVFNTVDEAKLAYDNKAKELSTERNEPTINQYYKHGFGVLKINQRGKIWVSRVKYNGKVYHLGKYSDLGEARRVSFRFKLLFNI